MKVESHRLNELYAHRFAGPDPRYAIVNSHGLGGHGGIYDVFCEHHAAKGVDIWSYDAPGHGRSTTNRPRGTWTMTEWAQASRDFAAHIKAETGLPVFTLGSSLGVAAAISAIDSYVGAGEQKKLDPFNTWSYDLASWASLLQYDPPQPLSENQKPVLYTAGEKDPISAPALVEATAKAIGGPVSVEIFPDAGHQLMLFESEAFSAKVHDFCLNNI
jgi:alpha-beta hydrolase superfamily lysophospholipase